MREDDIFWPAKLGEAGRVILHGKILDQAGASGRSKGKPVAIRVKVSERSARDRGGQPDKIIHLHEQTQAAAAATTEMAQDGNTGKLHGNAVARREIKEAQLRRVE